MRAVAVLSVVLYHLGVSERLGGGFVGVDVFFVISGYLITGILQGEVEQGRLSLAEFYNRRVRRIFPALFVVHLFCIVASALLLFPSQAREVGKTVLASVAFVSNIFFYQASGYFDQTSKSAPLLHTWSLSVEEQFYIGLPLLLFALRRTSARARVGVLAVLCAVSFSAATWRTSVEPAGAFYLVHYRAWELFLGSLLALGILPPVTRRAVAEALGVAGLALVLFGVFAIDEKTPFPGLWALPPCLGAFALLYSGNGMTTLTARLLGSLPFRAVGLVSYSLYLWHWPLIALHRARYDTMTDAHRFIIFALSLLASALSYRFVEQPFRRRPYVRTAPQTLGYSAIGMTAVAALAVAVPVGAARVRTSAARADEAISYLQYRMKSTLHEGNCFLHSELDSMSFFRKDLCLAMRSDRKNYLLVGDSHAAHYWPGLHKARPDINFLQATSSGCAGVLDSRGAKRCSDLMRYVFEEFLPNHHLDAVIIGGRWGRPNLGPLRKTIPYVKQFADRVIVLGPVVEYAQSLPILLSKSIMEDDPNLPMRYRHKQRVTDREFSKLVTAAGGEYYSPYRALCPDEECTVWAADGVPVQFDYGHLTAAGSALVIERIGPKLFSGSRLPGATAARNRSTAEKTEHASIDMQPVVSPPSTP